MRSVLALVASLALLSACAPVAVAPEPSSVAPTTSAAPTSEPVPTSDVPPVSTTAAPPSTTVTAPPPSTPAPVGVTSQVEITFYAAFDNDPAGSTAIDSPVIHKTAGGTGTWVDPLTFASPVAPDGTMAYRVGEVIYVPSVQKYFIREDSCAVSWTAPDGCGALTHVDLYMGNPSAKQAVLKCEDALTPDGNAPIVLNPAPDLPVDTTPLWSDTTGKCHVR